MTRGAVAVAVMVLSIAALAACSSDDGHNGTLAVSAGQDASKSKAPHHEPIASEPHTAGAVDLPLVMLLVDTSGSMERLPDCSCTTPACTECVPDCDRGDRSRFHVLLEALTGTAGDFSCEALARTAENGATYDTGYYLDYHRPNFGGQRDDGILDEYRSEVRFGLATFDGAESYPGAGPLVPQAKFDNRKSRGVAGLWSYGAAARTGDPERDITAGRIFYPHTTDFYFVDTGIRGPDARDGALQFALDDSHAEATNATIQAELIGIRPFANTPIAASLDDFYYLFGEDPEYADLLEDRPEDRSIIVITDGYPDDDYRAQGCNCLNDEVANPDAGIAMCGGVAGAELEKMTCPYPTAAIAARSLVQGRTIVSTDTARREPGPKLVDRVYVATVGPLPDSRKLDEIASAGGTDHARVASEASELRPALSEIMDEILDRRR